VAGSSVIAFDAWTFTVEDARRTIEVLDDVIGHAAWERPAAMFDETLRAARHLQLANDVPLEERLRTAWQMMTGVRHLLIGDGLLPQRAVGVVSGLFTSQGGVPKQPTGVAAVTHRGVAGDRQATRRHHGRPWQALCLWSAEVVSALATQGHPIAPGVAGENVSIGGVEWALVRPGVRLRLGEVLCEISAYAIPCRKNAQWFQGGRFNTMHHTAGPVSRVYATVLEPGSIMVGDTATLEP
jgi:MOSC domain-containing protein YiiM